MTKRAVITDLDLGSDAVERSVLEPLGFSVERFACRTEEEVIECARDADALMVQWAPITDRVLATLSKCQIISRYGIGIDMIDGESARRRGIKIVNVPDYCIEEVATHSIAMFLALNRQIVALDRHVRGGGWSARSVAAPRRLTETTVGVLGLGRIGLRVAQTLRHLGCVVIAHDPAVSAADGIEVVTLEALYDRSDALLLHCPLTPATRHIVDSAALQRMRPGSFIVNVSRGGLIDEAALADALACGLIGGVALDVFSEEPLTADSPLRDVPQVIATPHAAWYSQQALPELQRFVALNVARHFPIKDAS